MHTYNFEYDPKSLRLALVRMSFRGQGGYHIGLLIVFLFSIWGTIRGYNVWLSGFGVGISVAYIYWFWNGIRSYETRFEGKTINIQLNEEYCIYEHDGKVTTVLWNLVKEVWKYPDMWLLFSKDGGFFSIIPIKKVDMEGLAFLEAKVLRHGGKIR